MNLIVLGLGGTLLITLGLSMSEDQASIPASRYAAEAERSPASSTTQRGNSQASDRPSQLSERRNNSPTSRRRN